MRHNKIKFRSLMISLSLLLSSSMLFGCSSSNSESNEQSAEPFFDHAIYMDNLKQNRSDCKLEYISNDRPPNYWKSKKLSESDKYSWVEYDEISDYYDFRIEDPSISDEDAKDVVLTQKCIDFLTGQIGGLKEYEDEEAVKLLGLYQDLLSNRIDFLNRSQAMAALLVNQANRAKFLEIENAKRKLTDAKELTFIEIRKLIDYIYYNSVKVFIERCPDAFSTIFGNDYLNHGSVLLVNTSNTSSEVDLKVRYRDNEGVIVGDSWIYEDVPGYEKLRVDISASGASGPVGGGTLYPPKCSISQR